eukprot:scaffold269_cov404-Prasinococcus_capsulatus_cf.AAC.46
MAMKQPRPLVLGGCLGALSVRFLGLVSLQLASWRVVTPFTLVLALLLTTCPWLCHACGTSSGDDLTFSSDWGHCGQHQR